MKAILLALAVIVVVIGASGVFFEGEFIHRVGLGSVRHARQNARHGKADVA